MSRHTKRVVILISLLVSISLLTINSYGQGGSAEKTPPPSTKKTPARSTAPKRTGRSRQSSTASQQNNSQQADSQPTKASSTGNVNVGATPAATPAPTPAPIEKLSAPPEPTLNETLDWIGGKFSDQSSDLFDWVYNYINANKGVLSQEIQSKIRLHVDVDSTPYLIEDCSLTFKYKLSGDDGYGKWPYLAPVYVTFPFNSLNPDAVIPPSGFGVSVATSGSKPKLLIKVGDTVLPGASSATVGFTGYNLDRDTAKKVAKAMQHAIKLCGGKSDPF